MNSKKRILGLIPAKGGSTRLARKNIRALGGKSLLAWAADCARGTGILDRLIVSTEDEAVASEAARIGLSVPFLRPLELARDPAGVVDVGLHALSMLEAAGECFDVLIIMLPTCPFRTSSDIVSAYERYRAADGRFLMSVSPYPHTPFAAMSLDDGGLLKPFFESYIGKKSQEMPRALRANGAFHILDVPSFKRARSYYAQPLMGFEMPIRRSIDIDTEDDLREAEFLLQTGAMEP